MPPPKRRSQPPKSAPPLEPLGAIVREYEQWRRSQPGKPGKGALRQFWQERDRKHGQRPDYALWRQTQCPESPPERRQDVADLASRALRSPDPQVHWAAMALLPSLDKPVQGPMDRPPLPKAPLTCELVRGLAQGAPLKALQGLLANQAGWKPGKAVDLSFLEDEGWLPVDPAKLVRQLASAITRSASTDAHWLLTAWMLLRDARPPGAPPRAEELEVLLNAAQSARVAGDHAAAVRWGALFMHLLPAKVPDALANRARVLAWFLVENGIDVPEPWRVSLDDLPFPGDPPASEKGMEAARQFLDPADAWHPQLDQQVAVDPEWQRLRNAGVVLHHPLAALAWIGRKAHSYAVKKQHQLLRSAFIISVRHHLIGTTGRLLAHLQASPDDVMAYARTMRESVRHMPFLRSSDCWQEWAANLRAGWGRLEADAIHDTELVFFLHETVLDREVTTLRSLPIELRLLALRHLHSRRKPSALVQALEADPRLLQQLDHQRAVELWSIGSFIRERADQTNTAWVSLVMRGDRESGKYSLLVHGIKGQVRLQGRVKDGWKSVSEEVANACAGAETVMLASDIEIDVAGNVARAPSWEWAFRVLREPVGETPSEVLVREGTEISTPAATPGCHLYGGTDTADADTRWAAVGSGERRRSLNIGAHPLVISHGPLRTGDLKVDLIRITMAQATRRFVTVDGRVHGVASA